MPFFLIARFDRLEPLNRARFMLVPEDRRERISLCPTRVAELVDGFCEARPPRTPHQWAEFEALVAAYNAIYDAGGFPPWYERIAPPERPEGRKKASLEAEPGLPLSMQP